MGESLAWTFDTVAEQYEKMRPGYPDALYDDILKAVPLGPESRAVEIGIGGGQATPPILATGCQVTAVEYGAHLAALCRKKFAKFPNFTVVNAKFEDYTCGEGSCDLVYSAAAFHWIPEEIGYPKVFRMLKRGGVFARFACHPMRDKGNAALWEAVQRLYEVYSPGSTAPVEYTEDDARRRAGLAERYGFTEPFWRLYRRTRTFTPEGYTALLDTYSDQIALPEDVRREFHAKIEEAIREHGGSLTVCDTLDLELARKPLG